VAVYCDTGVVSDTPLFGGRIRSAEYSYDVSGDAVVRLVCEDVLAGLARRTLVNFSHDAVSFGSAVRLVCDNVDYLTQISIPGGPLGPGLEEPFLGKSVTTIAPYGTAVSAGVAALDYLTALEASEQGRIYADQNGLLFAAGRYSSFGSAAITFTDNPASTATYAIPYQTISGRSGGDVLYTHVLGYSPTTESWRSVTAAGTGVYGLISDLSMSNLRNANDDQVDGVIGLLADTFDTPEWRIQEISAKPLATIPAGTALSVALGVDLNSSVTVEFTPTGGSAISDVHIVEGVRHTFTPGDHTMALSLSRRQFDRADLIVLNTSTLAPSGTDTLAY
jgi:hypothetical protein